jgi:transitional endoplasmic reticulum ATPase
MSKWVGESENGIREVFRKAKQVSPCIVFFDEIDAMFKKRSSEINESSVNERMVSQMLTELDGLEPLEGVIVIGATNRVDVIDEALLRPGRFDNVVEIPLPDIASRKQIIQIYLKKKPVDNDSLFIDKILELTAGFSGAEIEGLINTASILALRDFLKEHDNNKTHNKNFIKKKDLKRFRITMEHFIRAKEKMNIKLKNKK